MKKVGFKFPQFTFPQFCQMIREKIVDQQWIFEMVEERFDISTKLDIRRNNFLGLTPPSKGSILKCKISISKGTANDDHF